MNQSLYVPRVVIAAPHGQSGKTTVTIGLIGALIGMGIKVQPFKKGPDFIDPSWLSRVAGRPCRNLDCFFMDDATIRQSLIQASAGAQITVIEGAMGMFDGIDFEGSGSTAQIAKILGAPVILVVDCHRMTRSVAALVKGFKEFDPQVNLAGVILNSVARPRHQEMLTRAIEEYCGLPVLGTIPKNAACAIPSRHLGLIPAEEESQLQGAITAIVQTVGKNINLEKIMEIAGSAPLLPVTADFLTSQTVKPDPVRIGVIRDSAFSFYYPENLEQLVQAGGELVAINALDDQILPDLDALFIGGGFPEVFAEGLSANQAIRQAIGQKIEAGLPVYAECGGLMYLGRNIIKDEQKFPMVGVLPFDVVLKNKPQGHGYTVMQVEKENPFFATNSLVRGHEFHNSALVNCDWSGIEFAFKVQRGHGIDGVNDGIMYKQVLAAYNHIHASGVREWAKNFIASARKFQGEKTAREIPRIEEEVQCS